MAENPAAILRIEGSLNNYEFNCVAHKLRIDKNRKGVQSMNCCRWLVGTLFACVAISAAASPHHTSRSAAIPDLNWTPCEDRPWIECATANVPLDYDKPRGATTQIALARVAATDQAKKVGTVFVNPGGPGDSGVNLVMFGYGEYLGGLLDGRFDIVGFDPRGIGASTPLYCFDSAASAEAFLADQPTFPYLQSQEKPFFNRLRSLVGRCASQNNKIMRHMSTADVARDMDLLRQAVGDERLTYLGFSYGSFLGTTYANLFPKKIRALAIDGVLDPRLWSSGWEIVSDRVATQQELMEFMRLCDEAGTFACALTGPGGAGKRYAALAEALHEKPLVFDDGESYGFDMLVSDTIDILYTPELWSGYATFLSILANAARVDSSAAETARALRRELREQLRSASPDPPDYNNGFDAYYGNHCSDAQYPNSFLLYDLIGIFAESGSIFGPYWWWNTSACANWAPAPDRYIGPWSTHTSAPVLVIGNYFDGITDYEGAIATSRLLKKSRLLTYAGWGHTAFDRSDCVRQHVVAYLRDGVLPPASTVCPANPNPFLPFFSKRSSGSHSVPRIGLPPLRPGR